MKNARKLNIWIFALLASGFASASATGQCLAIRERPDGDTRIDEQDNANESPKLEANVRPNDAVVLVGDGDVLRTMIDLWESSRRLRWSIFFALIAHDPKNSLCESRPGYPCLRCAAAYDALKQLDREDMHFNGQPLVLASAEAYLGSACDADRSEEELAGLIESWQGAPTIPGTGTDWSSIIKDHLRSLLRGPGQHERISDAASISACLLRMPEPFHRIWPYVTFRYLTPNARAASVELIERAFLSSVRQGYSLHRIHINSGVANAGLASWNALLSIHARALRRAEFYVRGGRDGFRSVEGHQAFLGVSELRLISREFADRERLASMLAWRVIEANDLCSVLPGALLLHQEHRALLEDLENRIAVSYRRENLEAMSITYLARPLRRGAQFVHPGIGDSSSLRSLSDLRSVTTRALLSLEVSIQFNASATSASERYRVVTLLFQ